MDRLNVAGGGFTICGCHCGVSRTTNALDGSDGRFAEIQGLDQSATNTPAAGSVQEHNLTSWQRTWNLNSSAGLMLLRWQVSLIRSL